MEFICERQNCTGCGLCKNVCPKKAISMEEAPDTGHFIPKIDTSLCIDCKLCQRKCPGLQELSGHQERKTYAAWRNDTKLVRKSSSGGIAASIYEYAVAQGYYVVGAYIDAECRVRLKVTNQREDIEQFRGSKYVQADAGFVYKECFALLSQGEKVIFLGMPCQCAAMRSMVKDRYENQLITVELICHGTPSQQVFQEYIHNLASRKKKKITKLAFRSEEGIELSLYDGDKTFWKCKGYQDDFLVAFQEGILQNEACFHCKYATNDRGSDLTIGDFWKIGEKRKFDKPDCKVSVVLSNTQKGEELLRELPDLHLEEREFEEALEGNPNLSRPSRKNEKYYEIFWEAYDHNDVRKAYDKTNGKRLAKSRRKAKVKKVIKALLGKA